MSVEVRFDADNLDDIAVLDAYCQAHGTNRKELLCQLLADWVDRQVHASTMVLRVKRINPLAQDSERTPGASSRSEKWRAR